MIPWVTITDFGDSAVLVPAVVVIALWLLADGAWQKSLLWLGLSGTAMAAVATSKIAFIGWGIGSQALDFTGISGHSMLAVSVLSVACWLLAEGTGIRPVMALGGVLLGGIVAVSRVQLHVHSVSEVVAGSLLGGSVLALYILTTRRLEAKAGGRSRVLLALGLLVVAIPLHGERAPSEQMLTALALGLSGHQHPFTRADWQTPDRPA
jgi:membrane-associated phospholipid phosphatase